MAIILFLLLLSSSLFLFSTLFYAPFDLLITPYKSYFLLLLDGKSVIILASLLLLLAIFTLFSRKKRPYYHFLTIYTLFFYYSILIIFHVFNNIIEPSFIVSKIMLRPSVGVLCLFLELILFFLLIVVLSSLNSRYKRKVKPKKKRVKKEESEEFESVIVPSSSKIVSVEDPNTPIDFPLVEKVPSFSSFNTLSKNDDDVKVERVEEVREEYNAPTASVNAFLSAKDRVRERLNRSSYLETSLKDKPEINLNEGPIIGFDDKRSVKSEVSSSIAPSNLSVNHPRYKMFEALQNSNNTPPRVEEEQSVNESVKPSIAPSNLSVDHPRYKMFLSLQNRTSESVKKERNEVAQSLADAIKLRKRQDDLLLIQREKEEEERVAALKREAEAEAENELKKQLEEERREHESQIREQFRREAEERIRQELREQGLLKSREREESANIDSEAPLAIGGLRSNDEVDGGISVRKNNKYIPPTADLLETYPEGTSIIDEQTRSLGLLMKDVMHDFKVEVELINIIKGPTVTMYEYDLAPGIMVSKVTSLQDNISMRIGGKQIRILAPVPGKSAIGIEVPNIKRATVGFKELLEPLRGSGYKVPMILGRNILGQAMMLDVAKTPHLLIAGTTGSGKSVCINGLIISLLYTKSPKEVRLIMVDPKVVELQVYNRIPHLLTPVITEPKRVLKMLSWLVDEMERRYRLFSQIGTRNIEGFNQNVHTLGYATEKMPYIVLIMDEFADLMTAIGKDIESYVARLMAKARAAGIHVVMATQRPSSEVITGTIKNNIPSRISFAVSSSLNSRIILDENGAESLLSKGDMLYLANGSNGLSRIQGAFLSDDEVDRVVSYVKSQGEPDYLDESIFEDEEDVESDRDYDDTISSDSDMYEKAKQIVFERKSASASYLQRRLAIGYNRAAKLVEQMEEDGIVGPANGSKPREILRYE